MLMAAMTPTRLSETRLIDRWWVRVALAWLVMVGLLIAVGWKQIAAHRFGDPDDALRLVEVRDLLAGQGWFDPHQYRIAAPGGVLMHWSRLVDIPLAGGILILRPLLGPSLAELVTLVSVPLLTLLAALLLVGRLTAKFFDAETVGVAALITAIGGPFLFQMTPMRVDHHGWQVVMALAALNGLAARNRARGGIVIGVSLAALLTISLEGLPLTAAFLATLGINGVIAVRRGEPPRDAFAAMLAAAIALALTGMALFAATRGFDDWTMHCDQLSPVHLALFGFAALGCGALACTPRRRWPVALAGLGGIGAATLALYLGIAPQCRGGAFVALDPLVYNFWYKGVAEGMPFWHLPLLAAVETVCVPLAGLGGSLYLWRTADPGTRDWWRDHALVLASAMVVGCVLARATATACAFAAIPTAALVVRAIAALREVRPGRRVLGYIVICCVLLPPAPILMWQAIAVRLFHAHAPGAMNRPSQCDYDALARGLNAIAPTDIFAPIDMGPDVLVRTRQRVVATAHHRGAAAMVDVISAFLGSPDHARAMIARRHASLVMVCPDMAETGNYTHDAPNGFMARLVAGKAPAWLTPIDLAPGSHVKFWRVDPAAGR